MCVSDLLSRIIIAHNKLTVKAFVTVSFSSIKVMDPDHTYHMKDSLFFLCDSCKMGAMSRIDTSGWCAMKDEGFLSIPQ